MITPIYQGSTSLKFLDKETKEMRLIRVVYAFNTSLRYDATAVRLDVSRLERNELYCLGYT